jgi:hypothetical protein
MHKYTAHTEDYLRAMGGEFSENLRRLPPPPIARSQAQWENRKKQLAIFLTLSPDEIAALETEMTLDNEPLPFIVGARYIAIEVFLYWCKQRNEQV